MPPLNMLALRMEQSRRGGGEIDRLQKEAPAAWQGRQSGRPPSHERGINIREKISQWEGRSQQGSSQDAGVKAHPPIISRTLSGDLLGNAGSNDESRGGLHTRPSLLKTKSTGLDFRESPAQAGRGIAGRKSEPLQKCSTEFSTTSPRHKPLAAQIFASPIVEANTANSTSKQTFTPNGDQKADRILGVETISKPLPLSTDDQEDMPAGNFYTSRGFWRRLEGDRLLWEKGGQSSGEAQPPPKPQRTFQYRGANSNNTGRVMQWDSRSPHNNHSNVKRSRVAHPPSFPPPPCPVERSEGLSRHKKNRKSFEYEDAARLTVKQDLPEREARNSGLYHAYSDDNIYEDIVCEVVKESPYEDVKRSPMCLPISRPPVPKLPPKPQTLQGYAAKAERTGFQALTASKSSTIADTSKAATPQHTGAQKTQRTPQYVNKIETIFDDKRGRKRAKSQAVSVRGKTQTHMPKCHIHQRFSKIKFSLSMEIPSF